MNNSFVAYNLKSSYMDIGTHEFKIVLNPKMFLDGQECSLNLLDCTGSLIKFELKKWGRKLNCYFEITEDTPDGVASIDLFLKTQEKQEIKTRLSFWIVK